MCRSRTVLNPTYSCGTRVTPQITLAIQRALQNTISNLLHVTNLEEEQMKDWRSLEAVDVIMVVTSCHKARFTRKTVAAGASRVQIKRRVSTQVKTYTMLIRFFSASF
uniref:Uncharacterized protein n=1 Tax=Tanacetum cinerariifolium TaxID=118510 RepID=A0A6L2KVX4_TANCI|nr:hypothetical protein [Tanacetum cinerariifolium]